MKLPPAAAAALAARYRARAEAEQRLSDFLTGIVLALDIDPTRVTGFDDATGELLLTAEAEADDPR